MSKKKTQTFSEDFLEFNGTGKEFFKKAMIATTQKDREMLLEYTKGDRKNLSHKQAYEIFTYMIRNPSPEGFYYILRNLLHNLCSVEFINFLENSLIEIVNEFWEDSIPHGFEMTLSKNITMMESVHIATIIKRLKDYTEEVKSSPDFDMVTSLIEGMEKQKVGEILQYVTIYDVIHPFRKIDIDSNVTEILKRIENYVTSDIQGASLDKDVRAEMLEERKISFWQEHRDDLIEEYEEKIKVLKEIDATEPDIGRKLTKVRINIS